MKRFAEEILKGNLKKSVSRISNSPWASDILFNAGVHFFSINLDSIKSNEVFNAAAYLPLAPVANSYLEDRTDENEAVLWFKRNRLSPTTFVKRCLNEGVKFETTLDYNQSCSIVYNHIAKAVNNEFCENLLKGVPVSLMTGKDFDLLSDMIFKDLEKISVNHKADASIPKKHQIIIREKLISEYTEAQERKAAYQSYLSGISPLMA